MLLHSEFLIFSDSRSEIECMKDCLLGTQMISVLGQEIIRDVQENNCSDLGVIKFVWFTPNIGIRGNETVDKID